MKMTQSLENAYLPSTQAFVYCDEISCNLRIAQHMAFSVVLVANNCRILSFYNFFLKILRNFSEVSKKIYDFFSSMKNSILLKILNFFKFKLFEPSFMVFTAIVLTLFIFLRTFLMPKVNSNSSLLSRRFWPLFTTSLVLKTHFDQDYFHLI